MIQIYTTFSKNLKLKYVVKVFKKIYFCIASKFLRFHPLVSSSCLPLQKFCIRPCRLNIVSKYINLEVLLLATWRYERNPHATGFLKCDEITEFKDLNLHKSRWKLEMIISMQYVDLLQKISVRLCCKTPLSSYFTIVRISKSWIR